MSNWEIWNTYGLTEEGKRLAEMAMPAILELLRSGVSAPVLEAVVAEADFQHRVLPSRSKEAQKRFVWKPKEPK